MKHSQCDREQAVLDALRSGRWTSVWGDDLRQHAAGCAVCAEVAAVAQEFLREAELAQAELEPPGARLPSAGLLWWKAQLATRRAAQRRAVEPIVWVERIAYALSAVVVLGFCVSQWPRISAWLHRIDIPGLAPGSSPLSEHAYGASLHQLAHAWPDPTLVFLLAASVAVLFTLLAFAAYIVWREE